MYIALKFISYNVILKLIHEIKINLIYIKVLGNNKKEFKGKNDDFII